MGTIWMAWRRLRHFLPENSADWVKLSCFGRILRLFPMQFVGIGANDGFLLTGKRFPDKIVMKMNKELIKSG